MLHPGSPGSGVKTSSLRLDCLKGLGVASMESGLKQMQSFRADTWWNSREL